MAVDATGIKVTNRGEWMRSGGGRGTQQAVSPEVSDEGSRDGEQFVPLVRQAPKKAKGAKVLGDGGDERGGNFAFLARQGIEAGILSSPGRRGKGGSHAGRSC